LNKKLTGIFVIILFFLTIITSNGISIEVNHDNIKNANNVAITYSGRDRTIEIAEAYANHVWYPTQDNIYHGKVGNAYVDTPDRDTFTWWPDSGGWKADEENIGVPYQWGGFSSIPGFDFKNPKDFDEQYTGMGNFLGIVHYAGDVNTSSISTMACGVDCSGFVSRCWNVGIRFSTRSLPDKLYTVQIRFDELQRGDALNSEDHHVMLFKEFLNPEKTRIKVIHATWENVHEEEFFTPTSNISEDGLSVVIGHVSGPLEYQFYKYRFIEDIQHPITNSMGESIDNINPWSFRLIQRFPILEFLL